MVVLEEAPPDASDGDYIIFILESQYMEYENYNFQIALQLAVRNDFLPRHNIATALQMVLPYAYKLFFICCRTKIRLFLDQSVEAEFLIIINIHTVHAVHLVHRADFSALRVQPEGLRCLINRFP